MALVLHINEHLPNSCGECFLCNDEAFGAYKCQYAKEWGSDTVRADDCPMQELPEHGDLVDRTAFCDQLSFTAPELLQDGFYIFAKLKHFPATLRAEPQKVEISKE